MLRSIPGTILILTSCNYVFKNGFILYSYKYGNACEETDNYRGFHGMNTKHIGEAALKPCYEHHGAPCCKRVKTAESSLVARRRKHLRNGYYKRHGINTVKQHKRCYHCNCYPNREMTIYKQRQQQCGYTGTCQQCAFLSEYFYYPAG